MACQRRTNIEAFNAMFGQVAGILDTTEIEKLMQELKEGAGREERKTDKIPPSHWWWFVKPNWSAILGPSLPLPSPRSDMTMAPVRERCTQELTDYIEFIGNLESYPENRRSEAIALFMREIERLFLDYFQTHCDEAQTCGRVYTTTLRRVLPYIKQFYADELQSYLQTSSPGWQQWDRACTERTRIEAFNAMLGNGSIPLNTEIIEKSMQRLKQYGGIPRYLIPKKMPHSHWWWFINDAFPPDVFDDLFKND